ncbi:hypothetical protein VE02_09352 [Pseudogymnoascus sp. 03VT05]|nr:hypothetical protein VE02_09352 [Pseudogymnoascus sp. 03VT05]
MKPPPPPPPPSPSPSPRTRPQTPRALRKKMRMRDGWAPEVIFGYCAPEPLSRIIYEKTAAAQWGLLRRMDAPGAGGAGYSVLGEDVGEICGGERAGRVALLLALKRVWRGRARARARERERERLAEWEWRVYEGGCGYEEAVRVLPACEKVVKAEAEMARG